MTTEKIVRKLMENWGLIGCRSGGGGAVSGLCRHW